MEIAPTVKNLSSALDASPSVLSCSPIVSIVIPTYNDGRFLTEAIESALGQTAGPCEVIVVSDGSSDDLHAVANSYTGVKIIRQPNQGVSSARNTGWRTARGHFVVFLDGDDRLKPNAVELNLRRFAECPECGFVYGSFEYIDADGHLLKSPRQKAIGEDVYGSLLREDTVVTVATVMHRRDCLETVGGFDEQLFSCEDYDLYLRLARRYKVIASDDCVCEYRRHGKNSSANIPLMLCSFLQVMRQQREYCSQCPRWQRAMKAGIRGFKRGYATEQLYQIRDVIKYTGLKEIPIRASLRVFTLAPFSFIEAICQSVLNKLYVLPRFVVYKCLLRR